MSVSRGRIQLAAAVAAVLALSCGARRGPPRAAFVAVWVAADSAPLTRGEWTRLAAAGALELFVEAARLDARSEPPRLAALAVRELAREMPATMVVTGRWHTVRSSPREIAEAWRSAIDAAALAVRAAGALPVGVHFDLAIDGGGEQLAAVLARLRRELAGRLTVSVALPAAGPKDDVEADLARAVDYVVADVFGQPPGAVDDDGAWDLDATRGALERLERGPARYAASAWTLGRAELRPRQGATVSIAFGLPLGRLLRSPALTSRPGAVFAGVDRQVFDLEARDRTSLGTHAIVAGDRLWIARPSTHDLEDLLALLAARASPRRAGIVLRQLPAAGESVSLTAANLAAALEPGEAAPRLVVTLVEAAVRSGRPAARLRLTNAGAESTDLGGGEWNYVQLDFPAGALGRVEPGDFAGWEQLWRGRERRTLRALREADTLRLYAPFVGAGERLESGPIEFSGRGGPPQLRASGRFILPGGRELLLARAPVEWSSEP